MKRAAVAVVAGFVLIVGARAEDKKEQDAFNGTWQATSVEVDGKPLPKEQVEKITLEVKGEQYTFHAGDQTIKGTHKLDPSKNPKQIDAKRSEGQGAGETLKGIYKLDKDTYEVCFAAPGKDRPTEFSSNSGGGHRLIIMKRKK